MDIINLMSKTPGLVDALKAQGLTLTQVAKIGGEITTQLRAQGVCDLTELLTSLDVCGFFDRIDIAGIANAAGIDADQAESAARLLAPSVEAFSGNVNASILNKQSNPFSRES